MRPQLRASAPRSQELSCVASSSESMWAVTGLEVVVVVFKENLDKLAVCKVAQIKCLKVQLGIYFHVGGVQ